MNENMKRVIVELVVPEGDMSMVPDLTSALESNYGFQSDPDWVVPMGPPAPAVEKKRRRQADARICIRGQLPAERLEELRQGVNVENVWTDSEIAPFADGAGLELVMPCARFDCQVGEAKGTLEEVAAYLGVDWIWNNGTRGDDVIIVICDTGVDQTRVAAFDDGWTPNSSFPPGTDSDSASKHGTMCANDASFICPNARIYDVGVLKGRQGVNATLSDAMMGYQWLMDRHASEDTPMIISNSWGIYQEDWAPDYATNPNHPFTRKVREAVDRGLIVLFAAGNCGPVCPSRRCASDIGSGRSIWGANGAAEVLTIGAANIRDEWIGYSSVGPAALDDKKPDFCAISHFNGFHPVDTGTSAATPIAAGVVALLKSKWRDRSTKDFRGAITETCRPLCSEGWDYYAGAGIINARAAYERIMQGGDQDGDKLRRALEQAKAKMEEGLKIIEEALA